MNKLLRFLTLFLFLVLSGGIARAQFPYNDSFKNSTAPGSTIGGSAYLTAAGTGLQVDANGAGYLRLTDASGSAAGYAYNNKTFPSTDGISVTFEYYTHTGSATYQADGISFFLFDASVVGDAADPGNGYNDPGFNVGANGGSLGYAQAANFGLAGARKGFIGIGFDEFGNYRADERGKPGTNVGGTPTQEWVTIRGDGYGVTNNATNYEVVAEVQTSTAPGIGGNFTVQGSVDGRTGGANGLTKSDAGYRRAKVEIVPNGATGTSAGFKVNVWITEGTIGGGIVHHVINDYNYVPNDGVTTGASLIPANLSYGYGSSTGGFTNVHEIRNLDIVVPASVGITPVAVADVASTFQGQPVTFDITPNDYDGNGNFQLNLASVDLDPVTGGQQTTFTNTQGTYSYAVVSGVGKVTFTPVQSFVGSATPINYTITDTGNDIDGVNVTAPRTSVSTTITVTVTDASVAPSGTDATITINEDVPRAFTQADFGFSDANDTPPNTMTGVRITTLPAKGKIKLSGVDITAGDIIAIADLGGNLTYTPLADENGNAYTSFTFQVRDDGSTSNGGVIEDQTPNTITINVNPVNDAPSFTINGPAQNPAEDSGLHTVTNFTTGARGGGTDENTQILDYIIVNVTNSSTLFDVAPAIAANGTLTYTLKANANGTSTVTVRIHDDGGTLNGGVNQSPTQTFDIVISPVNDLPTVADVPKSGTEDTPVTFVATDFTSKFTDVDGDAEAKIKITGLPIHGTLTKGSTPVAVAVNDEILAADFATLRYVPNANFNGVETIPYNGSDGTAYATTEANIIITIAGVNDLPTVADVPKSGTEDTPVTFVATDFTSKFTDVDGDAEAKIKITGLPIHGTLTKGSTPVAVAVNDEILAADFATLRYVPNANFNGVETIPYNGSDGIAYATTGANIIITIAGVNDLPTVADVPKSGTEDTPVTFVATDFTSKFTDVDGDAEAKIKITGLPTHGTLTKGSTPVAVAVNDEILAADFATLRYVPNADFNGVETIPYNGSDGTAYATTGANIIITIGSVDDAPVGTSKTITMLEDDSRILIAADFGFTDPKDNPANTFSAVKVGVPTAGTLKLNGTNVTDGQTIAVAALANNASGLVFAPASNANGSNYATISFQVQDSGTAPNNLDPTSRILTFNVTPVNDVPAFTKGADQTVTANAGAQTVTNWATNLSKGPADESGQQLSFVVSNNANTAFTSGGQPAIGPNGTLTYTPSSAITSQVTVTVTVAIKDDGGTANGGVDQSANQTFTIVINPAPANNQPPTVVNIPKSGLKDQPVPFTAGDFTSKFSDPEFASEAKIKIITAPTTGTLKLGTTTIVDGQEIPAADFPNITFVPASGFTGNVSIPYNGSDGVDYAITPANIIINILASNNPPVVADIPKTGAKDTPVTFTAVDFTNKFTDPDAGSEAKIRIISLPSSGTLRLNGNTISPGQEITNSDFPNITFTPATGFTGTVSFPYNGSDGVDYATNPANIVITITSGNLPPVITDVPKSGGFLPVTFTITDFESKYNDPEGSPLSKIRVVSLPPSGVLRLNNTLVTPGQEIPRDQIPNLTFTPAVNFNGVVSFPWNGNDGTVYANTPANVNITITLPTDPLAKIGVAKKLVTVTDAINGSYDVKFLFTLVNYGPNALENISLKDNLVQAFPGTTLTVKSVTVPAANSNLKANILYDGKTTTEMLLPASKLNGSESGQVELVVNVKLLLTGGVYQNVGTVEGLSAITGVRYTDVSTNGVKPDPTTMGDVTPQDPTPIELKMKDTFIPQGFSPNGDGVNDGFVIQNALNKKVGLSIYNRWGNRVYKSTEYRNDWTGTCNEGLFYGRDLPDGTYFYEVIIDNKDKYVGSVTINR